MAVSGNTFFFPWEVSLMEWLQGNISSAGISIISFFSMFGEEILLVLFLGFIYWCYDKKLGRTMGLSAIMGLTWNAMAKNIALRRRPYFDHEGIKILRVVEPEADIYNISAQGYSFPSGHSTNAVTAFGSLAVNLRKRWTTVVAVAIPLLTGFSRFVVGAHYPTDVLGGWLLGLVIIVAVPWLQSRFKDPRMFYTFLLLVTLPGFFYCKSADFFSGYGMLLGFVLGLAFEQRHVNFENTRSPLRSALRVVGGVAVFFGLNTLLKLPFSSDFLNSGTTAAFLVRTLRYALVIFVDMGVYPLLFRVTGKAFGAEKKESD